MANTRNTAAQLTCPQNIAATARNISPAARNIPRRPGRLRASDSPLAQRRLADKLTVGPQLEAAMRADSCDQGQLAIACGRDQGCVSRWHSPTSPDVPTVLDAKWARFAGLNHWARAAAGIALDGIVPMDAATRAALVQARDAIDALLGREGDGAAERGQR